MPIDAEPAVLTRTIAICALAVLLIAKICRECGMDALRSRLHALEAELFEFARLGQLETSDPAYAMLRDSIRSLAGFSYRISLTRYLGATLFGRAETEPAIVDSRERSWAEALDQIENEYVRNRLAGLRERLLVEVIGYLALGAVPLAPRLFSGPLLPTVPKRLRLAAIRRASIVEALAGSADQWPSPAWSS